MKAIIRKDTGQVIGNHEDGQEIADDPRNMVVEHDRKSLKSWYYDLGKKELRPQHVLSADIVGSEVTVTHDEYRGELEIIIQVEDHGGKANKLIPPGIAKARKPGSKARLDGEIIVLIDFTGQFSYLLPDEYTQVMIHAVPVKLLTLDNAKLRIG